jgi:uncharacterized cupredoxin-like copper-binding protein
MRRWMVILAGAGVIASLSAGCTVGAQSGTAANPRVINLKVDGYQFVPDHVVVSEGETVRFVVTNPTDMAHEVYIGTLAEQQADESVHQSAAPMEQAKVTSHMGYGEYLAAYSSIAFEYTFSGAQEVMIGCHLPGHWARGMKATVTVNRS